MKSVATVILMVAMSALAQSSAPTYNLYHAGLPDERVLRQRLPQLDPVKPITLDPPAVDIVNHIEPVRNGDVSLVASLHWAGNSEEQYKKFGKDMLITQAIWGSGCDPSTRYFVDFTLHGKKSRYTWTCGSNRELSGPVTSHPRSHK